MAEFYKNAEIFAWMPLIGFDKDLPDKGVDKLTKRIGFNLNGACLMVCHPDLVHYHEGMDKEIVLPPDMCSYYANPYNEERNRQEWTNYDLRNLALKLKEDGTEAFMSIFGIAIDNLFHKEWISDYPELHYCGSDKIGQLFVLKRFRDGTYYEDFFIEKLCRVMLDYGFAGLHVADFFCPMVGMVKDGDFSLDMLKQFEEMTGFSFPEEIISIKEDTKENAGIRGSWIWQNCRAEWIEFLCIRWETFFKKLCDRMHAIGKKVFVLGMYCTDPFDTMYCKGVDLKRIVDAGVDYLMPNMAANSSSISKNRHWPYYQWANMMPLTDAFAPQAKKYNMLAVRDASEEWDMIHHAPTMLDRDISFLPSYLRYKSDGSLKRCIDGYNICLADGIYENDWQWLKERFDIGFSKMPESAFAPTVVWSDTGHYNMLKDYINTRRWTQHKFISELNWAGAHFGAIVRIEDLTDKCGDLFIPNFDLISDNEKQKLLNYKGGLVICTAGESFELEKYNISPSIFFEDANSPYKTKVFAFGGEIENKQEIISIAEREDNSPALEDAFNARESIYTLSDVMPYQKVSQGIVDALAQIIKNTYSHILSSTHPVNLYKMSDGAVRMFVFNDDRLHYADAVINVTKKVKEVKNVSKFPMLPVKFSPNGLFDYMTTHIPGDATCFRVRVPQGGMGIVDIYFKD